MAPTAGLLMAFLCLAPGFSAVDETITSDTLGYCDALADRVAVQADMPAEARLLMTEGRAMCQRGHVVGGLRRLRLAVQIIRRRGAN